MLVAFKFSLSFDILLNIRQWRSLNFIYVMSQISYIIQDISDISHLILYITLWSLSFWRKILFGQPVSKYIFSYIGVFVYHYSYSMSNLFFGRFVRLCLKRIVQFLKTRTNKFGKICTTSFCSMQINIFIFHENNLIA